MISIVYLILIFSSAETSGTQAVAIPQANMQQCNVNAKSYAKTRNGTVDIDGAFCIVGVK